MEDVLRVGVISSTHGLKGEVKVFPTTDDPSRFMNLQTCLLFDGKNYLDLTLERVRFFKQFVIVKFKDIDDISQIEKYKGKDLFVTRRMRFLWKMTKCSWRILSDLKWSQTKRNFWGHLRMCFRLEPTMCMWCARTEEKRFCCRRSKSAFWM